MASQVGTFIIGFGGIEERTCDLCATLSENAAVARFAATLQLNARLDLLSYLLDERAVPGPLRSRWVGCVSAIKELQTVRNALAHNGVQVEVFLNADGDEHHAQYAVPMRRKQAEKRQPLAGYSPDAIAQAQQRLIRVAADLDVTAEELASCKLLSGSGREVERARATIQAAAEFSRRLVKSGR